MLAGVSNGVCGTDEAVMADAVMMAGESASLGPSPSGRATGSVSDRRFLWRETEGEARERPRVKESLRGRGGGGIACAESSMADEVLVLDALWDREMPGEEDEEAKVAVLARAEDLASGTGLPAADERRRISCCCCEAITRYFGRLMRARKDRTTTLSRERERLPSTGRRVSK